MSEKILIVRTSIFHDCGHFDGFTSDVAAYSKIFDPINQEFMNREAAESDPTRKQLIPYIIVRRMGRVVCYKRGTGQGESRLHSKSSIGIGGHINPCDLSANILGRLPASCRYMSPAYQNGMLRELVEELKFSRIPEVWDMQTLGMINDDTTDVGKVHLGVAHLLTLPPNVNVSPRESEILEFSWHTVKDLQQKPEMNFESWSRICLDHAFAASPRLPKSGTTKGVSDDSVDASDPLCDGG